VAVLVMLEAKTAKLPTCLSAHSPIITAASLPSRDRFAAAAAQRDDSCRSFPIKRIAVLYHRRIVPLISRPTLSFAA